MQKYKKISNHANHDVFFSYFCSMNMNEAIRLTVDALRQGKTILYPTDTIWGLGCDARNRPTTYILPRSQWHDTMHLAVADNIPAADGTLGVRMPRHAFCQEVIRLLGAPLVSTSANLSGRPSPKNYNEIEDELRRRVDFCVPPLPELLSEETRGSRIVKINADGSTTVLRP